MVITDWAYNAHSVFFELLLNSGVKGHNRAAKSNRLDIRLVLLLFLNIITFGLAIHQMKNNTESVKVHNVIINLKGNLLCDSSV